jgi:hypothetical protein
MSGGFQVDPAAIDGLIQVLDDAANLVREANSELGGFGGEDVSGALGMITDEHAWDERSDLLGNETLAGAAAGFANSWRYGLDKLDDEANDVIGRLRETRRTYDGVDEGEGNVFSHIGEALDGGGSW